MKIWLCEFSGKGAANILPNCKNKPIFSLCTIICFPTNSDCPLKFYLVSTDETGLKMHILTKWVQSFNLQQNDSMLPSPTNLNEETQAVEQ